MVSKPDSSMRKRGKKQGSAFRWIVLAAVLVGSLWFGLKTIREAPVVGEEGGGEPGTAVPEGLPPASVIVAAVEKKVVEERRRMTGTLKAESRAEVAAQESGAVREVAVDEGDVVKEGDTLARLDARRLDAELAQARARVTVAEAMVAQREAESKRAATDFESKEKLFTDPAGAAVSEREVLDAEREADVAMARTRAAKDEWAAEKSVLDLLEVRRGDLEIVAPFDGRVVARQVEPGEWVAAGAPVVTLVSAGEIEAWFDVPERFAASIEAAGKELVVRADGNGHREPAKALRRVADVDVRTRLFSVVVTIDDGGGALVPGMSVNADLPVGEAVERLAVPVDAIMVTQAETFVFRAAAPSGAGGLPMSEKVTVTELFRRDGVAYVESAGLEVGDTVVVEGNERLFPGTPLIVSQPASPVAE